MQLVRTLCNAGSEKVMVNVRYKVSFRTQIWQCRKRVEIKDVQHFSGVKSNHRLRNALEIVLSGSHWPSGIYCYILLVFNQCVDLYLLNHQDDIKLEWALTSSSSSRLEGALEEPSAYLENAVILIHYKVLISSRDKITECFSRDLANVAPNFLPGQKIQRRSVIATMLYEGCLNKQWEFFCFSFPAKDVELFVRGFLESSLSVRAPVECAHQ